MSDDWPQAFALAEHARSAFAGLVDEVRSGAIDLEQAHRRADDDPIVGRIFAVKVYEAVPGIGKVLARRTMDAVGLDEDVSLARVGPAERAEIAARFTSALIEGEGYPRRP